MQWLTSVIPATQKAEIRRIEVQGQPRRKVSKTPSQQISWTWWYTHVMPTIREAKIQFCFRPARAKKKKETPQKKKQLE
jgi:hypothetical protein